MTITQTIEIPPDRRLIIDVPSEIPTGQVTLTFTPATNTMINECPICMKNSDPRTGELRFNAETIAAIKEGDAMFRGEIPVKRYNSLEEMLEDLDSED